MDTIGVSIIVAVITGIFSLIGVIINGRATQTNIVNKVQAELHEQNAIQNVKIDHLTDEVRKHNNFAEKIPKLETRVDNLETRVSRLEDR